MPEISKQELAQAIYFTFTTGFFKTKPAWEAISEYLLRLIQDDNPQSVYYISKFDLQSYLNSKQSN